MSYKELSCAACKKTAADRSGAVISIVHVAKVCRHEAMWPGHSYCATCAKDKNKCEVCGRRLPKAPASLPDPRPKKPTKKKTAKISTSHTRTKKKATKPKKRPGKK